MTYKMTYTNPASHRSIARILDFLETRPATTVEIALHVPCDEQHARKHLRWLHSQGAIHVETWKVDEVVGRRPYPRRVWAAGPGVDAARPDAKTPAQATKDYRERMKQEDPIKYQAKRRLYRMKSKPVRCDVAASWIGGTT